MDDPNMNPYGSDPTNGTPQGTPFSQGNPYGTQSQTGNPYGAQQNPYGAQTQTGNPYGAQQNPYGAQSQAGNPYGAQPRGGVNPYAQAGTNPYAAAAPYGAGAAPVPPKPPKKKMPTWVKALIFGGVGAAVLGVGLYFLLTRVVFPPKKTVDAAFENSFSAQELFMTPLTKELGVETLSQNIRQSGGYFSFDLAAAGENSTGDVVHGEGVIDKGAKQLSAEGSLQQNGKTIVEADLFADDSQTYITIQDLMNGYVAISNKNIISGLKNSKLLEGKSELLQAISSLPDFSLDYFGNGPIISGLTGLTGDDSIMSELWDKSKVSRAGSETINIGTDSISTKKYEVTIPKEALQDALGKMIDQALNSLDDAQLERYLQQAGVTSAQVKQLVEQARSVIKNMITEDFKYYTFIYEDKVVSIQSEGTLKLSGVAINYGFDFVNYSDDEKAVVSLKASLNVMGQKIEISGSINSRKTGSVYEMNVDGSLQAAGRDVMSLGYTQSFDPSTKKISGTGSLQAEGSTALTLSVSGDVTELTPGKSISLDLSEIKVRTDAMETAFSLKATVSTLDASGKSVKPLDSAKKVVNVMTASEEEIRSVIDENSAEYKKFMDDLDAWTKSH